MTKTSDPHLNMTIAYGRADVAWDKYGAYAQTGTGTKEERLTALRAAIQADKDAADAQREYDRYLDNRYS